MSQRLIPAKLGRTPIALVLPVLVALGVGFWWLQREELVIQSPNMAVLESKDSATPASPTIEAPVVLNELTAPEAEVRGVVEAPEPVAPVKLDAEHPLRGRVVPDMELPADESLEIVVEAWKASPRKEGETVDLQWYDFMPDSRPWTEVTRILPSPNGRFEAPRPVDATKVRLRVVGDYIAQGEFEFDMGGEEDPGEKEFELAVGVGAHVTLRLALDGLATEEEVDALVGDKINLESTGQSNSPFSGMPYTREGVVGNGGQATLRGIQAWPWSMGYERANNEHQNLAPFRVAPNFEFEPAAGERLVIDVPMERGQALEGVVVDVNGDPIADADINIAWHWKTASASGDHWEDRESDEQGRFRFQALPQELDGLVISAHGYFEFKEDVQDLARRLLSNGPHTFILEKGHVLHVAVTDGRGLPAYGLPLTIQNEGGEEVLSSTQTDENGLAQFVGLPEGPFVVSGAGRLRKELQKEPDTRSRFLACEQTLMGPIPRMDPDVETLWCLQAKVPAEQIESGQELLLQVQPAPTISGIVLGADATWPDPVVLSVTKPDPNIPSFVQDQMMSGRGEGTFVIEPQTGRFVGSLPPGKYTAVASSGKRPNGIQSPDAPQPHVSQKVEFEVGIEDMHILIPFDQALGIRGSLRLPDGTPLAGIKIAASRKEGWFTRPAGSAVTDGEGRFEFESQGPDTYLFRLDAARYMLDSPLEYVLSAGVIPEPLDLVAVQSGAFRVRLLAIDGSEKGAPEIYLSDSQGARFWTRPIQDGSDWDGANGPVVPGSYNLAVTQEFQPGRQWVHRQAIAIEAGRITDVVIREASQSEATVSGKVTSGGEPIEGLAVWISDSMGVAAAGETDKSGSYRFESMATGPMQLHCGRSVWEAAGTLAVEIGTGPNAMPPMSVPSGGIDGHLDGNAMMDSPVVFRAGAAPTDPPFRRSGGTFNGNFQISYLPDGLYEVTTVNRKGQRTPGMTVQTVEIKNGETVRGIELKPTSEQK